MVILNSGMSYVSVEDIKQLFTTRSDCTSCTKLVMLCVIPCGTKFLRVLICAIFPGSDLQK